MAESVNSPPICPGEHLSDGDEKRNLDDWFKFNEGIPMETKLALVEYDLENPIRKKDFVAVVKNVAVEHLKYILDIANNMGESNGTLIYFDAIKKEVHITFDNEVNVNKFVKILHWRKIKTPTATATVTLECYKREVEKGNLPGFPTSSDETFSLNQLQIDDA